MQLRRLKIEDRPFLHDLLRSTSEFTDGEVTCAMELVDESCADPLGSGYWSMVAAGGDGLPLGLAIYGPTPMTEGAFDLYWIATSPACRGQGVGRALIAEVESDVLAKGGHVVRIETSAKDAYGATRKFYEATRYRAVGHIPDFYRKGDGLVILAKNLDQVPALDTAPRARAAALARGGG